MTIGGDESVRNYESSTRDTRAVNRLLIRKSDFVYAEDIADRVAIPVQHERRHRLLLLELFDLASQAADFLPQSGRIRDDK